MEKFNFEQTLKRLEEITNLLEKNEIPLDQSIELFEEGMKLKEQCEQYIQRAEKKILKIMNQEIKEISEEEIFKNTNMFENI